jgi:hypothetical protein
VPAEAFAYLVLQVVPNAERDERMNAGVVLFSRRHRFLQAKVHLDRERLRALDPDADADAVQARLDALAAIAAGEGEDRVARMEPSERFHWLAAPASTVVRPSATHTGVCADPQATLDKLFARLVG